MEIKEAASLAMDISEIDIHLLSTKEEIQFFCQQQRFHSLQEYLSADFLVMLQKQHRSRALAIIDCFQIRYLIYPMEDQILCIGPYCVEQFTTNDYRVLLKRYQLPSTMSADLDSYRSSIPVTKPEYPHHLLRCILKHSPYYEKEFEVVTYDYGEIAFEIQEDSDVHRSYDDQIRERYATELTFMNHIQEGKATAAIADWKSLHRSVEHMKHLGQTMETARLSAAVNRTTIRIAAMNAGMSAELNHQLSRNSNQIIFHASSLDEINREHERIIREYCSYIRKQKEQDCDNLVLLAIYQIEHQYTEPLTVQDIADELGISVNHLIILFRNATGQTPKSYLNNYRLKEAGILLKSTALDIQEISARVGILDANYFTKIFKRYYGISPSTYRKTQKL